MPVSMVDERAMSVVTWLNAPKRRRQKVSTMSDHLADSVSDSEVEKRTDTHRKPQDKSLKNVQASVLAPEDSEWATW